MVREIYLLLAFAMASIANIHSGLAQDKLRATFIGYPTGDSFSLSIENGARSQAAQMGVDLTVQKLKSYELSEEVAVVKAAIASKPDAIIVPPLDENGLQATLDEAKQRGIIIVLWDNNTRDRSTAATFVSGDITELGRNAAREFQKLAGDRTGSVFYQGSERLPEIRTVTEATI